MKKTVVMIALLLLAIVLYGCRNSPSSNVPPELSGEEPSLQPGEIMISKDTKVVFVRSDDCTASMKSSIGNLGKRFQSLTGIPVQHSTGSEAIRNFSPDTVYVTFGYVEMEDTISVHQALSYGDYGIFIQNNTIAVAGWNEGALTAGCGQLLNIFNLAYHDGVITLSKEQNRTFQENNCLSGIPKYGDKALKTVYDCGDNGWMIAVESGKSDYNAYLKALEEQGYSRCAENQIGQNLYVTYQNDSLILNVSYYESAGEARVFCDPAATTALPVVSNAAQDAVCTTTMAQLQFVYSGGDVVRGMGYVFRTSGGKFVIVDGGKNEGILDDELYRYLYENAPDPDHIVVAAWLFTHGHGDHVGTFINFAKNYSDKVTVEQFVFNRPSDAYHAVLDEGLWKNTYSAIKNYYGSAEIVKAHPGQRFVIDDLAIDIYFTIELYAPETGIYNDSSVVMMVTVKNRKILLLGDSSNNVARLIMSLYGDSLKADFVQLAHHGYLGGGSKGELYALADPTYVLMPGSMEVYEERKDRDYLKPLVESVPFERWYVADIQTHIFTFISQEGVTVETWS